jgi:hypothetical protein
MKENFVIDPLISKRQQLLLATQLCRMVLKVSNVPVLYLSTKFTIVRSSFDPCATHLSAFSPLLSHARTAMSGKWIHRRTLYTLHSDKSVVAKVPSHALASFLRS